MNNCRLRTTRNGARFAVLFGALVFMLWNVGLIGAMDTFAPTLRDPEYGRRLKRLQARHAERPDAKLLVVLGSSRVAMGVRPEFCNDSNGPVVVNFAHLGSGPTLAALTVRRMLADGVRPDAVLLEYWPPFLRGDGEFMEQHRLDAHRYHDRDREFILTHFENPQQYLDAMESVRQFPVLSYRRHLVSQSCPGWLPYYQRLDAPWNKLDRWGWLPGFDENPSAHERMLRHNEARKYYDKLFANYSVTPNQQAAFREVVTELHKNGVKVALLWMPESSEFRAGYPDDVRKAADEFLATVRNEFDLELIDARTWAEDITLADGFHLTQPGASDVSRKLAPALKETFPELWGVP
jgi:hypothetical protein